MPIAAAVVIARAQGFNPVRYYVPGIGPGIGPELTDLVIDNPPDSLADGDLVRVAQSLPRNVPHTRESLP
jgi:hypothetical protein